MGAPAIHTSTAAPAAIHNILFATDFSSTAEAALPFALALAKRFGAALFVTHILPPEPRYELAIGPSPDAINADKQEAQARFDALLASGVLNDVVHEPILRSGDFWDTMQEVIADRAIDLIVTGTHGRQGLSKMILGSVAEIIFRHAACPVLTVGPHAPKELIADGIRRVLFTTDFSPASLSALPYAYSLAEKEGAQLTLLHVVQVVPPAIDTVVMPMVDADLADDARKYLQAMLLTYAPLPLQPEVLAMSGPVAETIVDAAAERKVAMIVMGVRHKSSAATHFPWSVADAVVCRAHCPVLTVRGE
jgi:nucleotide-binding universal stress UspA family protein